MTVSPSGGEVSDLRIRPITLADTARVHEWASQERVCRYQPWGPNTREETAAFVTEAARTWEQQDSPRRVWVAEVPMHGVIGNGEIKRRTSSCMEIAYAVHPDYWGRGLGTDIADLLVSVAFADSATERVQATCDPRNEASARVLKNVGMSIEGTLRHTLYLRDGWRDSVMHSVLRQEWLARAGDDYRVSPSAARRTTPSENDPRRRGAR